MIWPLLRASLMKLDAERAHELALRSIRHGSRGLQMFADPTVSRSIEQGVFNTTVFGKKFRTPIGLAAGFDKNAQIIEPLGRLGFGYTEIGTVTPRPQDGNPRPRLFRDAQKRVIFNRMGFNNHGADVIARRLAGVRERSQLPNGFRIGVNIGKNKDTPNEESHRDYQLVAKKLAPYADYVVVNVSSPNTPGLRSLQTVQALTPIILSVRESLDQVKRTPLLIKLAPELTGEALQEVLACGPSLGVDGWILTNTLSGSWGELTGGLSGSILTEISRDRLVEAKKFTELPIISVGGVMSARDVSERLSLGAQLVQIYSGWIFGGPLYPYQLLKTL